MTTLDSIQNKRPLDTERLAFGVLLLEQLLIVVIGGTGAFYAERAASLIGFFIVALLLINLFVMFSLFTKGLLWRVRLPSLTLWLFAAISISFVLKLVLSREPVVVALDGFRVTAVMSAIVLGANIDTTRLAEIIRSRRRSISALITLLCGLVILGRLRGWTNPFLAGDPIVGLLVLPALLPKSDGKKTPVLIWAVTFTLVAISLKRTAWLALSLALAVLAVRSLIRLRIRAIVTLTVVALAGCALLVATGASSPILNRISRTDLSGASDSSVSQRDEEVRRLTDRIVKSPVSTSTWGLSPETLTLENGNTTHAIHNTLVFLIAYGGGAFLLFCLLTLRRSSITPDFAIVLGALMGIADSLGGNTALNPSLGFSIAIFLAWIRRSIVSAP